MPAQSPKLQQVIAHFVGSNQKLGAQIMAAIAKMGSIPNAGPDQMIAQFTSDPALTAKIKEIISQVNAGHSLQSIIGYHITDPQTVQSSTESIQMHKGAVQHILTT